jgi:hypothetical protein
MGSVMALKEKTPLVPGRPTDRKTLIDELKKTNGELQVESRLTAYHQALSSVEKKRVTGSKFFFLVLDANSKSLSIAGFRANQLQAATEQYVKTEQAIKANKDKTNVDTVLVSVSSLQALRHAYPSYFLDTTRFMAEVKEAIGAS